MLSLTLSKSWGQQKMSKMDFRLVWGIRWQDGGNFERAVEFCMIWLLRWQLHSFSPSQLEWIRPCLQEPLQCSWTKDALMSHRHGLTFVISSALQRSLTIQVISPWLSQFRVTARIHFKNARTIFSGQSLAAKHLIYAQKFSCHPPRVCTTRQVGALLLSMIDRNLEGA